MSLNPKIKNWKEKRVWIIGASTGIGAALARRLHAKGARVIASARSADKLDALVRELGKDRALAVPLDITDVESIRSADARIETAWGGYDLVVVGVAEEGGLEPRMFSAEHERLATECPASLLIVRKYHLPGEPPDLVGRAGGLAAETPASASAA